LKKGGGGKKGMVVLGVPDGEVSEAQFWEIDGREWVGAEKGEARKDKGLGAWIEKTILRLRIKQVLGEVRRSFRGVRG